MTAEIPNLVLTFSHEGINRPIALLLIDTVSLIERTVPHPTNHISATGFAIGDFFASPFALVVYQTPVRLRRFDKHRISQ